MLVIAGDRASAILHGGEIHQGFAVRRAPVDMDLAIDAQARHAAVGDTVG